MQQQVPPAAFWLWETAHFFSPLQIVKKVPFKLDLFNKAGFFQMPLYNNRDGFRNALEI
jgi:hypothetical protein